MIRRYKKKITALLLLLVMLLLFTRLIGLNWGLPYPLHPDERNMADAVTRLSCDPDEGWRECFHPGFFAYGQAPLYIAYGDVTMWHALTGRLGDSITFVEAAMALRLQSVAYSLLTVWVLMLIVQKVWDHVTAAGAVAKGVVAEGLAAKAPHKGRQLERYIPYVTILVFTFQAYAIQYAHFGTTESLLMLLYASIVLVTLQLYERVTLKRVAFVGVLLGIGVGVKISSLVFAGLPGIVVLGACLRSDPQLWKKLKMVLRYGLCMLFIAMLTAIIISPHNLINWQDFLSSMNYEVGVGDGSTRVFYTRQFENTIPWLFQFITIFPFSHGQAQLFLFVLGFFFLPWRNGYINILRLAFLMYFLPSGWLYAKWSRFMAPVMPIMTLLAYIFVLHVVGRWRARLVQGIGIIVGLVLLTAQGVAYLPIYASRDVRFEASEWMIKNIPEGSHVLLETGNVVNLPIQDPDTPYQPSSFTVRPLDVYNLDGSSELQAELDQEREKADYIVIASRRVFANHTCRWPDQSPAEAFYREINPLLSGRYPGWCDEKKDTYPAVNRFFTQLLDEQRYQLVEEFTSYPRIDVFGTTLLEFPDEYAEEAWTVFDHPVVRVYRAVRSVDVVENP